jgi:hypothetical protein
MGFVVVHCAFFTFPFRHRDNLNSVVPSIYDRRDSRYCRKDD